MNTSGGTNFVVPALTVSFTFPCEIPEIPKSITYYKKYNFL